MLETSALETLHSGQLTKTNAVDKTRIFCKTLSLACLLQWLYETDNW